MARDVGMAASAARRERNLLLVKVHRPTNAMLERICHIAQEKRLSTGAFSFHVQYYIPDEPDQVMMAYNSWCRRAHGHGSQSREDDDNEISISILSKENLTMLFGQSNGQLYHRRRYGMTVTHELAFHAMHRSSALSELPWGYRYDFLWVLEQDVAWQGNIYEALALLDSRDEDLLCYKPRHVRSTDEGGAWWDLHDGAIEEFPAALRWIERSFSLNPWNRVTRLKCNIFFVRYSRRIMDGLLDSYLSKGHWAYDEVFGATLCSEGLIDFQHRNCSFCKQGSFINQCKVGDYSRDNPELFNDPYFAYRVDPPYDEKDWNYSIHHEPMLYHPMKF